MPTEQNQLRITQLRAGNYAKLIERSLTRRLWSHRAEDQEWKSGHHILRYRWDPSDATVPFQHRRYYGFEFQVNSTQKIKKMYFPMLSNTN